MLYIEYEQLKKKYHEAQKKYDQELTEREIVDEQMLKTKAIIYERKELLDLKEQELRISPNIMDKVYVYRNMNKLKIYQIAMRTGYSDRQICRYIKEINNKIDKLDILS